MPTASRLAVLAPVAFWMSPYGSAIQMFAGQLGFIVVGRPLADPVDEAEFRSVSRATRDKARRGSRAGRLGEQLEPAGLSSSSPSAPTCQRSPLRGSL